MAISAWERRNNRRTGRFPGDMVSQFLFESIRRGEEGRQGGFCATLCVIRARARINWGRRISCRISNIMAENRAVWRSAIMGILPIRSPIPSPPPPISRRLTGGENYWTRRGIRGPFRKCGGRKGGIFFNIFEIVVCSRMTSKWKVSKKSKSLRTRRDGIRLINRHRASYAALDPPPVSLPRASTSTRFTSRRMFKVANV